MITAVDTNILLDIIEPQPEFLSVSLAALERASVQGSLVVCDYVYAELCGRFRNQSDCDRFLDDADIRVEALSRAALYGASRAWRAYRKEGGTRERLLVDFLVGAHATHQATQLLSRGRGFYRRYFSGLPVVDPTRSNRSVG